MSRRKEGTRKGRMGNGYLSLLLAGVAVMLSALPAAGDDVTPELPTPKLYIDAIPGLTTVRHLAPTRASITRGTRLRLIQELPEGATVTWQGADEVLLTEAESVADCQVTQVGPAVVRALIELPNGENMRASAYSTLWIRPSVRSS